MGMVEIQIGAQHIQLETIGTLSRFNVTLDLNRVKAMIQKYTDICTTVTLEVPVINNAQNQIIQIQQVFINPVTAINPTDYTLSQLIMTCPGTLNQEQITSVLKGRAVIQFYNTLTV